VNTSHGYQPQGYINNTPVIDPYTRSPVGDGGSGSISEHRVSLSNSMLNSSFLVQTPQNQRGTHVGDRNAARMGQQVAPALQQSHSSRVSTSGREWNASHQPSHVRSGNAASLHNVQEQYHYVQGVQGNYHYLPCRRVPALILNNSSSTSCYAGILRLFPLLQQYM
jgi:hypothetical protein